MELQYNLITNGGTLKGTIALKNHAITEKESNVLPKDAKNETPGAQFNQRPSIVTTIHLLQLGRFIFIFQSTLKDL